MAAYSPARAYDYNDKLIIDLGMHDGSDTYFYLKKDFNVVAVEANPLLAAKVTKRFARYIRAGHLRIINKGAS